MGLRSCLLLLAATGLGCVAMNVRAAEQRQLVGLSHTIEHSMVAYTGLPEPLIGDHLRREQSCTIYAPGSEYQIGRITMVANAGTYLDTPLRRFAAGGDLADFDLTALEGVLVRAPGQRGR